VVGRDVVEQFPPALPIPPVFKKVTANVNSFKVAWML